MDLCPAQCDLMTAWEWSHKQAFWEAIRRSAIIDASRFKGQSNRGGECLVAQTRRCHTFGVLRVGLQGAQCRSLGAALRTLVACLQKVSCRCRVACYPLERPHPFVRTITECIGKKKELSSSYMCLNTRTRFGKEKRKKKSIAFMSLSVYGHGLPSCLGRCVDALPARSYFALSSGQRCLGQTRSTTPTTFRVSIIHLSIESLGRISHTITREFIGDLDVHREYLHSKIVFSHSNSATAFSCIAEAHSTQNFSSRPSR